MKAPTKTESKPVPDGFSLDKRIPITFVIIISIQIAAFGVWIGVIGQRVTQLEISGATREHEIARSSRMEAQIDEIFRALLRVETKVNKAH